MYSAELDGRDELEEAGRGGKGEVAVAKSSVAISSELEAGVPQAEQKRPAAGMSVPQAEQAGMNFSRYSLPRSEQERVWECRPNTAVYYHPNDESSPASLVG
jgi:hypothetical protein